MPLHGNSATPAHRHLSSLLKSNSAPSTQTKSHTAPHRQSAGEVAREHGVKRAAIIAANPRLAHQSHLAPGDKIDVPQHAEARATRHQVEGDETPKKIADKYGILERALREENGLEPHEHVRAGDALNVPEAEGKQGALDLITDALDRIGWKRDASPPTSTDPSLVAIEAKQQEVAQAEASYNEVVQSSQSLHPTLREITVARQWDVVQAKRAELAQLIETDLDNVAKSGPRYPGEVRSAEEKVAGRMAQIISLNPGDQSFADTVTWIGTATLENAAVEASANEVKLAYEQQGPLEAARVLDEQTLLHPELAARILTESQDTVDKISKDLGEQAEQVEKFAQATGGRFPPTGEVGLTRGQRVAAFDETLLHLSNASYNASLNEGGAEAVDAVADSIAKNIPKDEIGRFDEAFRGSVREGGGATLALAVADKLQLDINATDRKDTQADNIVNGVRLGLDDLRKDTEATANELARSHVARLVTGYGQIYDPSKSPAEALENFKEDNPEEYAEYEALIAKFDAQGAAVLRAEQSLAGGLPPSLEKLSHADDLINAKNGLEGDSAAAAAISSSAAAEVEITKIVNSDALEGASIFDNATATAGLGKASYEAIGQVFIRSQVNKAVALAKDGDLNGALEVTRRFQNPKLAAALGIDPSNQGKVQQALDQFDMFVRSANGITDPRELVALSEQLDSNLTSIGFERGTQFGNLLRGTGLVLGGLGAAQSVSAVFQDGTDPTEVLTAAAATLGFGKDVGELLLKDSITDSVSWSAFGKGLAGTGIFLDLLSAGGNLFGKDGDKVEGLFDVTSAAGGALSLAALVSQGAAGSWLGPAGVFLTTAAALGKFGYGLRQQTKEIDLLERDDSTRKYLMHLGFDPKVANVLSNTDGNGLSPIPVLAQWAEDKYGYDMSKPEHMKAFVEYINTFETHPEDLDKLVKAVHRVDRADDGTILSEFTQLEWDKVQLEVSSGKDYFDNEGSIESLSGLDRWAVRDGIDLPPPPPVVEE
jgi:hypothetical protein